LKIASASKFAFAGKTTTICRLSLSGHENDSVKLSKVAIIHDVIVINVCFVFLNVLSNVALFQAALTKVPTFTLLQTKQREAKEA